MLKVTDKDISFMNRAISLAARARGMTSPNPMVGAILVKNGRIIASDYHRKPGQFHAEALVINSAKERAKGATLYVSLEPCCHKNKRTPPCTEAIIRAGIKKVYVAMEDPNPKVSGKGIKELTAAGIEVFTGILEEKAKRLNEAYIKYITTGMPFVTLKVAMTLDGKIATPTGQSKWITGENARKMVHRIRNTIDAVITAIGTIKADDPLLTVRGLRSGREHRPLRVVIDPNLEIPFKSRILITPPDTLIVMREGANLQKKEEILKGGVRIIEYPGERLDLRWLMKRLGEEEITSVLIEGGSSLNARALEDGVVDKVLFFIAPKIIGGKESYPAIGGKTYRPLEEAHLLKDVKIRRIGEDILIEGYINYVISLERI